MASLSQWWVLLFLVLFVGPLVRLVFYPSRYWRDRARWNTRWDRYFSRGRDRDEELETVTAELQSRMAQIDSLESRVLELESRLDFAERVLAKPALGQEVSLPKPDQAPPAIV
jgi:hypothetical protein